MISSTAGPPPSSSSSPTSPTLDKDDSLSRKRDRPVETALTEDVAHRRFQSPPRLPGPDLCDKTPERSPFGGGMPPL